MLVSPTCLIPTRFQEDGHRLDALPHWGAGGSVISPRHQWMVPQAKTYYARRMKYALNWIEVYGDWLKQNPKPGAGDPTRNSPITLRGVRSTWLPA